MSGTTLVLFSSHWLRIADGAIVARGTRPAAPDPDDARVVAVVPAADTVAHTLVLPDLTDPQARAAARLAIGAQSAAPLAGLHIAVGPEQHGERVAIVIDVAQMDAHLLALSRAGFDPDALVPAVLIPPRPDSGFVRADLGGEVVVRGVEAAFGDDPVLTPLLASGAIVTLEPDAIAAAIIAAAADPPVDLRQGVFAKRRSWPVGGVQVRRMAWLAALCVATLFAIPLGQLYNLSRAAQQIERRTTALAQSALPLGSSAVDPVVQLNARLAQTGAGGRDFLSLANLAGQAVAATPTVEIAAMRFEPDAALRITVHGDSAAELDALERRLRATGLAVTATSVASGGRPARDLVVSAP